MVIPPTLRFGVASPPGTCRAEIRRTKADRTRLTGVLDYFDIKAVRQKPDGFFSGSGVRPLTPEFLVKIDDLVEAGDFAG